MCQKEFIFFDPDGECPSVDSLKDMLNPSNIKSPYYNFIGNSNAINKLMRLDITALRRYNHCCNDLNIAIIGKAGCGKTELVKCHTKANGLPLVEIHPKAVKSSHDIFLAIQNTCKINGIELFSEEGDNFYVCPPINVFIDEVHALSNNVVQALLKATEQKDRQLITEDQIELDCSLIHWIIATTDRGKLFDAFDTRFSKINLSMYSKKEISQIIHMNYEEWPKKTCDLVAHYCSKIPREALAFAKELYLEHNINYKENWEVLCSNIAKDNNIDKWGMHNSRVTVLKSLKDGAVSSKVLPIMVGVKQEELENFILPFLIEDTEDQSALISISPRGYILTEEGEKQLKIRGII